MVTSSTCGSCRPLKAVSTRSAMEITSRVIRQKTCQKRPRFYCLLCERMHASVGKLSRLSLRRNASERWSKVLTRRGGGAEATFVGYFLRSFLQDPLQSRGHLLDEVNRCRGRADVWMSFRYPCVIFVGIVRHTVIGAAFVAVYPNSYLLIHPLKVFSSLIIKYPIRHI